MDQARRELLVARVCSGKIRLGEKLFLFPPDADDRYEAALAHGRALEDALADGLYGEAGLLDFLLANGLWTAEQGSRLDALPRAVEDVKVDLFKDYFREDRRAVCRGHVATLLAEQTSLLSTRHAYHHLSAAGHAALARTRHLVAAGLRERGKKIFPRGPWKRSSPLLDEAVVAHDREKLSEAEYRELARTEPWRSIWAAREACRGVFGVPAADLSEDQKTLIYWSNFYDNVGKHPACPSDAVIQDDPALDGFLIDLRRQSQAEADRQHIESGICEQNRNAQSVFLPVSSAAEAQKIDSLNSPQAAAVKRRRFAAIAAAGEQGVREEHLPDSQEKIRQLHARGG